jgi:transposase
VLGAVRQLSTLETVSETLRLALRALEAAAPLWVTARLPEEILDPYARSQPEYRLSAAEREAAVQDVGRWGFWLLDQLAARAPAELRELEAVQTLGTVWEQRYQRVDGAVQVRATSVPCTERIVTPHDPGVRAGEKRGHTWHGDKTHVTETAEPARPNFITDVTTANASSGDGDALLPIRSQLAARDLTPAEQYVDSGYISGKQLAESQAAGIALLGPALADTSPNGFKIADFTLDAEARQALCPGGQRSVKWRRKTERDGTTAVQIQFAAASCATCAWRPACTTSQSGRSLHINEYHALVAARRQAAQTLTFWEKMRARPGIEATLSELVRAHGFRRHRYRGDQKRHAENLWKAAACNLKRLIRALGALPAPPPPAHSEVLPVPGGLALGLAVPAPLSLPAKNQQ